eukprot:2265218-Rhodomonas_salina.1
MATAQPPAQWMKEREGGRSAKPLARACMGSARRLTCPSRDWSRACHVLSMPRRSRDTGSRDQSPRPSDWRSRADHVTCGSVT